MAKQPAPDKPKILYSNLPLWAMDVLAKPIPKSGFKPVRKFGQTLEKIGDDYVFDGKVIMLD